MAMKAMQTLVKASAVVLAVSATALGGVFAANAQDCNTTARQTHPISLGVSGSNLGSIGGGFCCGGTLGSLVQAGSTQYILSNNHVLATGSGSQLVIQPGLVDLSCIQNSGFEVADGVRSISISPFATNTVDAAIAQVIAGDVNNSGQILNIGNVAAGNAVAATLNLAVTKMGRTTCVTSGSVTAVNVTIRVTYPTYCSPAFSGTATFANQIEIGPSGFSAAGDSGSLIVTTGSCPRAVGLLFAGGSTSTFANPMTAVLSDFGATMVGQTCAPTTVSPPSPPFRRSFGPNPGLFGPNPGEVEAAAGVKQRHEGDLLAQPGVLGTGVGVSSQGQPVIKVYVEKATPAMRDSIPSTLESLPVQIEETGPIVAY
jgi:hypothetical protein